MSDTSAPRGDTGPAPPRGEIRVAPEGGSYADYTPTSARDATPWTLRTADHRHIMRTTHVAVAGWRVAGHLSELTGPPTVAVPADSRHVRVFVPGDDISADVAGVLDRYGEIWPAHEWHSGTTSSADLVRINGPLIEIPASWLAEQLARRTATTESTLLPQETS